MSREFAIGFAAVDVPIDPLVAEEAAIPAINRAPRDGLHHGQVLGSSGADQNARPGSTPRSGTMSSVE
jgi:hypothetical protein